MAFIPVKKIPCLVEIVASTCSVITRGDVLRQHASGMHASSSVEVSMGSAAATLPTYVAAETVSPGSGIGSTYIMAWPVSKEVCWEALCSSTPTLAMTDTKFDITQTTVMNETTTDQGAFLIDELYSKNGVTSSATSKIVIGRIMLSAADPHS